MNLLLLHPDDFVSEEEVLLTGRREQHAREVLKVQVGEALRVGRLGGDVGEGEVLEAGPGQLRLRVALSSPPPPRPGVDLILAIPRPKQLKRVVTAVASLGVDRLVLLNAARVERSYFDSKVLAPGFLTSLVEQGLEQARDTVPPEILLRERFRPFVEDELAHLFPESERLVPHPSAERPLGPSRDGRRTVLAVGPEGGWVPFELELLSRQGFIQVSVGPRILRTETVVPLLLGRLGAREGLNPAHRVLKCSPP